MPTAWPWPSHTSSLLSKSPPPLPLLVLQDGDKWNPGPKLNSCLEGPPPPSPQLLSQLVPLDLVLHWFPLRGLRGQPQHHLGAC